MHNEDIVKSKEFLVPYISSDTYLLFDKKIVHSYAKKMPFSELLSAFHESPPDIYNNVFYNR